ncbi:MAG: hypothetical protein Q8O76_00495 [Chloroflexota bacterium]|nr:hypothetical protein [Chloroflexota bacterium]
MELVIWFALRTVFGFSLASVLGVAGFFAGWVLWYPSLGWSLGIVFRVCGAGIGAGIGAFVGWLRPEDTRAIIATTLGLALLGGLLGAWGGVTYGGMVYKEALHSKAIQVPIILGAALASNAIPAFANIFWAWYHRKL